MINYCKNYLKEILEKFDIGKIFLRLEAEANYQVPKTALILVNDDRWIKRNGIKDKKQIDNDMVLFDHRYRREVIFEVSLIGPSEHWISDVLDRLAVVLDKKIIQDNVYCGDIASAEDAPIDISIDKTIWQDSESRLRNICIAQIYIKFIRDYWLAKKAPYYTDIPLGLENYYLS